MKHLKTFEGYHDSHLDGILDKISKSGISSLSDNDKKFLDAYKDGDDKIMSEIERIENQRTFISSDKYFTFRLSYSEESPDGIYYYGTLTVPDLVWENGKTIDGEMEGYIWIVDNKQVIPVFDKGEYDVLEFCNGLEYELDNFLDYVVSTIEDEKTV